MEPEFLLVAVGAAFVVAWVLLGRRKVRHRMTRAGLRRRAFVEAARLFELVEEREASRPARDAVVVEHEIQHRRVTLHDEGTQRIYAAEHLAEVEELREQFARRGIRSGELERYYREPANSAGLRTVATALEEMAQRLR
ncbi:hypothetical protein Rxycam_01168 [Rubrobacter xylanophilus DSM 9941]|uniref:hypothetical protein n=1 Tax=Rubrobacter xylanophilus TaxID=49319 RepID=UPI001C6428C6|nr:hypothetical protein [Rubrobacter xylanophilus]QYJ15348.1 hypothetical protein Rxycam_01168 [Rubrobacter xylanophilus DSM 9941]